ncbi:calpain-13 isoform A [Alligator mississippiensis]|uniref:Calpain-13 isoform A n=1 Tax=Alligator mississippiensis TaxID=8496 RepID=A0A151P347_ALLMI|nr:calpain-13 isoform A [Alligator mississippiensis]
MSKSLAVHKPFQAVHPPGLELGCGVGHLVKLIVNRNISSVYASVYTWCDLELTLVPDDGSSGQNESLRLRRRLSKNSQSQWLCHCPLRALRVQQLHWRHCRHFQLMRMLSPSLPATLIKNMMLAPGPQRKLVETWQTRERPGSPQNLKKLNNQDFNHLRSYYLSKGQLFEDGTFPAHASSIGPQLLPEDTLRHITWRRPIEIQHNPRLIMEGVSRFDIVQGEKIGDCWVLAALGSLTLQKHFLENVLPKDQEFQDNYAGIFHFRFWHFGDWVDVVIDDKLPFLNDKYLFVHPRTRNEFWPSLLEKAYAKLRGSYQNLHWGYISEALVDFTGGVQLHLDLPASIPKLEEVLKAADKSCCLMGCTTPGKQSLGNTEWKNGLVKGHAYTVTGAREIPYKNGSEHIIRLWNPWGHGEWKGPWSDGSAEWNRVPTEQRRALCEEKDDGEFWMSCQDFRNQFSSVYICNSTPTFLDFGDQHNTTWFMDTHASQWIRGLSAGGSKPQNAEAFSRNPQYFIKVVDADQKENNVVVSLMQKPPNNAQDTPKLDIGFFIFWFQDQLNGLPAAFFSQYKFTPWKEGFIAVRDITGCFTLSQGTYVIIPVTSKEGQESEFLLRIFLRSQDYSKDPNTRLSLISPKDVAKQNQDNNYENIFLRYAKQGSDINASQLQRILNEVLLKDQTAGPEGRFSFDSCRGILALMDLSSNGRLTLQEFKNLWKCLAKYKDFFKREARSLLGLLDASDLRNAVQAVDITATEQLLHLMALRYGNSSRKINFPDFVCCMIRLETMAKVFYNLTEDGRIYFNETQWLIFIMYC